MTALALIAARACEKVIVAHFRRRFRTLAHEPAAAFRLPFAPTMDHLPVAPGPGETAGKEAPK